MSVFVLCFSPVPAAKTNNLATFIARPCDRFCVVRQLAQVSGIRFFYVNVKCSSHQANLCVKVAVDGESVRNSEISGAAVQASIAWIASGHMFFAVVLLGFARNDCTGAPEHRLHRSCACQVSRKCNLQ